MVDSCKEEEEGVAQFDPVLPSSLSQSLALDVSLVLRVPSLPPVTIILFFLSSSHDTSRYFRFDDHCCCCPFFSCSFES